MDDLVTSLKADLHRWRIDIGSFAGVVDITRQRPEMRSPGTLSPEAGANITLAFRHLEDARMRLGKAIQAIEGGTSIWEAKDEACASPVEEEPEEQD